MRLDLIITYVANAIAVADATTINTLIPVLGHVIGPEDALTQAGAANLLGLILGHVISGYLCDMWRRDSMMFMSLFLLAWSTQLSGALYRSDMPLEFVFSRAMAGVASAFIANSVNITKRYSTSKKQRLKLQALQGFSTAVGSIAGQILSTWYAQQNTIFELYLIETGLLVAAECLFPFVGFHEPHPPRPPRHILVEMILEERRRASESPFKRYWKILRSIDYVGILSGAGALVSLLAIMHNGFSAAIKGTFAGLLGACGLVHTINYFRNPLKTRPVIDFKLFRKSTLVAIYAQNFFFGMAHQSFSPFMTAYLLGVRHYPPMETSIIMSASSIGHALWAVGSAYVLYWLQKRGYKSYQIIFVQGFSIWIGALIMLAVGTWGENNIPTYAIVFAAAAVGIGIGATFSNSTAVIQQNVEGTEIGVALGLRDTFRYLGGFVGLLISIATVEKTGQISWAFSTSTIYLLLCVILCMFVKEDTPPTEDIELGSVLR